jgi:hypothetical protein
MNESASTQVTLTNESWLSYALDRGTQRKRVMSRIWLNHGTRMSECASTQLNAYVHAAQFIHVLYMYVYVQFTHVMSTQLNASMAWHMYPWHSYLYKNIHIYTNIYTYIPGTRVPWHTYALRCAVQMTHLTHTYEWVTAHVWIRGEHAGNTCRWFMPHVCIESCHPNKWVVSPK